jgi:hypothetical protein
MAIIMQIAVSAQNTFSDKFFLAGSGTSFPSRSALICATRSDSTVTLRRYGASKNTATPIASLDVGSTMEEVLTPVEGWYDVGVATGNYGAAEVTITVEQ